MLLLFYRSFVHLLMIWSSLPHKYVHNSSNTTRGFFFYCYKRYIIRMITSWKWFGCRSISTHSFQYCDVIFLDLAKHTDFFPLRHRISAKERRLVFEKCHVYVPLLCLCTEKYLILFKSESTERRRRWRRENREQIYIAYFDVGTITSSIRKWF